MIKKIKSIDDYGIFVSWKCGSLPDFKRQNLIYAWNGSGKSTLSRLLQSVQTGVVDADYQNGRFSIELSDGSTVDSTEEVYKFVNQYSHSKIVEHDHDEVDAVLPSSPQVITKVLDLIKASDSEHYQQMMQL